MTGRGKDRNRNRSRMFTDSSGVRVKTWNPIVGCYHDCSYCWARRLAERYYGSFSFRLFPDRLRKAPKSGVVFVVSMGDLFGSWVPSPVIRRILSAIRDGKAEYMFFTKNPARYREFLDDLPPNSWLGVTIETDLDEVAIRYSKAPPPSTRAVAMNRIDWPRKVVSVEPILRFSHPETFARFLAYTGASLFYVGYDNYPKMNQLDEPPLDDTRRLISLLRKMGKEVREKTIRERYPVP